METSYAIDFGSSNHDRKGSGREIDRREEKVGERKVRKERKLGRKNRRTVYKGTNFVKAW